MLRHAQSIPGGSTLTTSVCVIGAGPAGITCALELAAAGVSVCLLESGEVDPEPAAQELSRGVSDGETYHPLDDHGIRVRAFGGSSRHWRSNGPFRGRPLDPLDFEVRPGVAHSGWPIARSSLDQFYGRAQEYCRLGPSDYRPGTWHRSRGHQPLPQFPEHTLELAPFQLSDEDWSTWRPAVEASASIDAVLGATVIGLRTDEVAERVSTVDVRRSDGATFTVAAERFVLAAHTIENTRLLLLGNENHPRGLGNAHDVLGRYFQDHLAVQAAVMHPRTLRTMADLTLFDTFKTHVEGVRAKSMLAVASERSRREELLNSAFFLYPSTAAQTSGAAQSARVLGRLRRWRPLPQRLTRQFANVARHPASLAQAAVERKRATAVPDRIQLLSMTEQEPNPDSRITLTTERDANGVPRPRLTWRLTEVDHRSLRRSVDIVDETVRSMGWGHLSAKYGDNRPQAPVWGSFHQLGTTRMADDPKRGVVDRDLRVHGLTNLHVVGGSVFPTGGYANPTLSIVALAIRLAKHLSKS